MNPEQREQVIMVLLGVVGHIASGKSGTALILPIKCCLSITAVSASSKDLWYRPLHETPWYSQGVRRQTLRRLSNRPAFRCDAWLASLECLYNQPKLSGH